MSALARVFFARGVTVTGSDAHRSALTESLEAEGIIVFEGTSSVQVPETAELVVYSSAIAEDHPERVRARALGITERSYFEVLGDLTADAQSLVVAGTNGKSTTTAMLASIMLAAKQDPTVVVGTLVPALGQRNARAGMSSMMIVEGCEHHANILKLHPAAAIITNVEEDHLDYYRDLNHIVETFQQFVSTVSGVCVLNADDPASVRLQAVHPVRFGSSTSVEYQWSDRRTEPGAQSFAVTVRGALAGRVRLLVPGEFNAMNALAALALAMEYGVSFETCVEALSTFTGTWRRFERVGVFGGADILSDYGHHPSAITATVAATREFFPGRRVVLCFQPHQHSRTKELLEEFIAAVPAADVVVVPEIYGVLGRTEPEAAEVSSRDIVDAVLHQHPEMDIHYTPDLSQAETFLRTRIQPHDVVLVMGAGDVDIIARSLCSTPRT